MADLDRPQITLITPPEVALDSFPDRLAGVLDRVEVACLRLSLASRDADTLGRAADALRVVAHARDVAIVIDTHGRLVVPHGLDGVHLADGGRLVRDWRRDLGADAIVGAYCGQSRHDGIGAAEAGADYVAFGPVGGPLLGRETLAEDNLFAWWSEMIEIPVIAEGGLDEPALRRLGPVTDFVALGSEIWSTPDPAETLARLAAVLG